MSGKPVPYTKAEVDALLAYHRELLAIAERLYNAHGTAPMIPFVESLPWSECCTDTVRRWVAVAREARRMHRLERGA